MTTAYLQLVEHLGAVRSSWNTRRALEAGMLTLAVAVASLAITAACDYAGKFGVAGRVSLSLVFWACLLSAAWRTARRDVLAKHSDDFFAALIEQSIPGSRNRFINAFQLGRETRTDVPGVIRAIVDEGLAVTDELEPSRAVVRPATRRNAMILAATVGLVIVYWLIAGPGAWTSMARVLLPTADIPPFAWTRVTVTPGEDLHILEGSVLAVKAETSGRVPGTADIQWKIAGRTFGQPMTPAPGGVFTHDFAAVQNDMSFRVHAGDAGSGEIRVAVDPRPRVEEMRVEYEPPPYAGVGVQVPDDFDGHLRGLPRTAARLRFSANKPLAGFRMTLNGSVEVPTRRGDDASTWLAELELRESGTYRLVLEDTQGYTIEDPSLYTVVLKQDDAPRIAFARPGVDTGRRPGETVEFRIAARDDLGLARIVMRAVVNNSVDPVVVRDWNLAEGAPRRSHEVRFESTTETMGLAPGDRMRYWAEAIDRNDVAPEGPGRAATRRYTLVALSPEEIEASFDARLRNYVETIGEMIRLQRLNRAETAAFDDAAGLIRRQVDIRGKGEALATQMEKDAFPAQTLVQNLRELVTGEMADVIAQLESYRDVSPREKAREHARRSLPVQDRIIATLEEFLTRLERAVLVRHRLKKIQRELPDDHAKVLETIDKLAADMEKFLGDVRDLEKDYERLAKREDKDLFAEEPELLEEAAQRLDRWKQWFADSVDAITKLPQGFVDDSYLAESLRAISEEIEKKPRKPTVEIATPVEEGAKALGTEMMEDFEMWTPDRGDSIRWVMEDPVEGIFEVPEEILASDLQDIIGKLIEDMEEFDEAADDVTGAWGGNMQMGWGIMDGPISSYNATGKTGNQLPNASEMGGRSGSGRRGRSSGQMVGDTSRGMEGRPTPARVSNEPYQDGVPNVLKQLDPRGATGGGRKTGGGQRGLQGGTPPDVVKDMDRLKSNMEMLREKTQQVARRVDFGGRPASHVMRSLDLLKGAEQDMHDRRYEDAARKRKLALGEMRAARSGIDQAVGLSLQKARAIPAELREEIGAGARGPLPQGYEDLVGAYYRALSTAGQEP